jgi:hypothetical protein
VTDAQQDQKHKKPALRLECHTLVPNEKINGGQFHSQQLKDCEEGQA